MTFILFFVRFCLVMTYKVKANVSVIAANVHPNENCELVVVDPARRMAVRLLVVDPAGRMAVRLQELSAVPHKSSL